MTTTDQERVSARPFVGQSVRRVEDVRFLTGQGRYLSDIQLPDPKHMAILRSPVAHAHILSIDVAAARELPGVVAAFTGTELARVSSPFSHLLQIPTIKPLEWYVLATDKVRFVGEPLACVVADSRYIAEDALDLIEVEYEELPAVVDAIGALADGAPLLYNEWGDNNFLQLDYETGDVAEAFAEADGVLTERIVQHRIVGLPLEGHGASARFDPSSGDLLLYASSQQPHNLRTVISDITGISEGRIRVVAPDIGGGFGNKQHFMREEALVALVATQLPYSVSWLQDRYESLTSSVHSREQTHEVQLAYSKSGRALALRATIIADVGDPVLYFTGASPAMVTTSLLTGTYDIRSYAYSLTCVATNKCPIGAYRGFGQPQAFVTIERLMDRLADEVGLDPAEVRRTNMIPDNPRPYISVTGARYDVGSFGDQFNEMLEFFGYERARAEQEDARRAGRCVGIGLSSIVEATAPNLHSVAGRYGGFEMANVSVQPDGHINVLVGTKSQGQGHVTSMAQVAADVFTVPIEWVSVEEGDSRALPYGMGTWGSRSAVMGGGAVLKGSEQLRDKMLTIAAHMLKVRRTEVDLTEGVFRKGSSELPFEAVASAAYLHTFLLPHDMDMGLSTVVSYDPGNTSSFPDEHGHMNVAATYASAAGAARVEVDPASGNVQILDFAIVHDCGRVINPMIVDGQIQGAFAQAIGSVFLEEIDYSAEGQPLTTTLLDYLVPLCGNVPAARILHRETPSPLRGGFRGAGEAGLILAPAALINAVADALRPYGVKIAQTNLGAHHLRRLLREAGVPFDPLQSPKLLGLNITRERPTQR